MALNDNILGAWECSETSGTTITDAVSGNNATLHGSASLSGKLVSATSASTTGGAGMGQITALDITSYPVSLDSVFNTSRTGAQSNSNMKIGINLEIGSSPYSQLSITMRMAGASDDGIIDFRWRNTAGTDYLASSTAKYNDGADHYAMGTIDASGNMTLYIDGSSVGTATASGNLSTGKYALICNDDHGTSTTASVFIGYVKKNRIWSRCVSSAEVVTIYNGGAVLSYPFSSASAPTVTSSAATSVGATTATGNGNVTADGGATITERGVVVGTSANPTTSNTKFTASGTTGSYTAALTGLTASTAYHCRAYAINSAGTSYGADETFTTTSSGSSVTITPNSTITIGGQTIDTVVINFH